MPHSSGGSSHSGGVHSGSSGGGSGSANPNRVSNTYFEGSHRFVYYHDGKAEYVFSANKNLNDGKVDKLGVGFLIGMMLFCPLILLFAVFFNKPNPLQTNYTPKAQIIDFADRFTDVEEQNLIKELNNFYDLTGVPTLIITKDNKDWQGKYSSLERYAYELYVNKYNDEDHWLILYSDDLNEGNSINVFTEWYFEGMQGDNTDDILTSSNTRKFNEDLDKQLLIEGNTVADAFIIAFSDMRSYVLDYNILEAFILYCIFGAPFVFGWEGILLFGVINAFRIPHKYKDYIACPEDATDDSVTNKEIQCSYCGGIYYKGTVLSCPHCGAPIEF